MSMKKKIQLLLTVVVVALLAACGQPAAPQAPAAQPAAPQEPAAQDDTATQDAEPADGAFRMAFVARSQADPFAVWLSDAVLAEAAGYANITVSVYDGMADDSRQNNLIEDAITQGYDIIVVQPNNGEVQRSAVEAVVSAGILAMTTNARIDGVAGASSVDADPFEQGAVQARAAIDMIPQDANVVVLLGPPGNFHADERERAWDEIFFSARPDVNEVGRDIANWETPQAQTLMEDWIIATGGDIDAIISMNDGMVIGAITAWEMAGNDGSDILSFAVDGTAEAVLAIRDGRLTQTTLQSANALAELILATAYDLLTGAQTQVDVDIDNPVVTIDNVQQFIDMHIAAGNLPAGS